MKYFFRGFAILRIALRRICGTFRSGFWGSEIRRLGGKVGPNLRMQSGAQISIAQGGRLIIGANVFLAENSRLLLGPKAELILGEGVFVGANTVIATQAKIEIGAGSQIAHNVTLIDHDHALPTRFSASPAALGSTAPIAVGNRVWIAANAIVLKGVEISPGSVVAAGAVVTKNVPAGTVALGREATNRPFYHA